MDTELLEQILSCKELPSLPAAAAQVIELTSDENVSMDELATTIQNDQALAAKILRTVNSSFYGLREPCSTIKRALIMMGLKPVKTLALTFSLVTAVEADEDPAFDYVAYWRRGLYTAIGAHVIMEQYKKSANADEAFLGGLLQDIGVLAMYKGIGEDYLETLTQVGEDHRQLARLEVEKYELQHPDVGAMLVARWKLPDQLMMPVKFHERPTAAPGGHAEVVRAVAMGNLIHDVLNQINTVASMKKAYDRGKQWFGLLTDEVDAVAKKTTELAGELSALFNIDTGPAANADKILSRATRQLSKFAEEDPSGACMADESALIIDADQIDDQTGLFNPKGFQSVVRSAYTIACAKSEGLCLGVLAVDGFSDLGADAKLSGEMSNLIVRVLKEQFGTAGGVMGRLAPDLFAVTIAGSSRTVVSSLCESYRESLTSESAKALGREHKALSASIGLAEAPAGRASAFKSSDQLLAAALRAAQAVQKDGGNALRVFVPKAA